MSGTSEGKPGRRRKEIERRRRRRVRRVCRLCMTGAIAGLGIVVLLWCDRTLDGQPASQDTIGNVKSAAMEPQQEYPESLLTLMEMNPETQQFVLDYFQNKDEHPEIDLSGEVEQGTVPLFLQWDSRWGYETYGSDFMAITGCGPTCLSMVLCGLSGETEWDPLSVARYAQQEGYYVKGSGTAWDMMTQGAEDLGLTVDDVVFDAEHILTRLQNGSPIICAMRPGDFTTTGHFIVLSGVDGDGRVTVCDPNSKANSEKSWDVETLLPQIKNLWAYRWYGSADRTTSSMTGPWTDPGTPRWRIKELREQRGISVRQLQTFLGFEQPQAIYKWQRGECLPTFDNMYAMACFFHVKVDEILVGSRQDLDIKKRCQLPRALRDLLFVFAPRHRQYSLRPYSSQN